MHLMTGSKRLLDVRQLLELEELLVVGDAGRLHAAVCWQQALLQASRPALHAAQLKDAVANLIGVHPAVGAACRHLRGTRVDKFAAEHHEWQRVWWELQVEWAHRQVLLICELCSCTMASSACSTSAATSTDCPSASSSAPLSELAERPSRGLPAPPVAPNTIRTCDAHPPHAQRRAPLLRVRSLGARLEQRNNGPRSSASSAASTVSATLSGAPSVELGVL